MLAVVEWVAQVGGFQQAYVAGLADILRWGAPVPSVRDSNSAASDFGTRERPYRELLGHSFELANGAPQILLSRTRPMSAAYAIGLFIWNFAGSSDVESIGYYNNAASRFADDGYRLCGAFGERMWRMSAATNQIDYALDLLRRDPASRRAYVSILDAADLPRELRDYPCAIGLQLFLRDGRLDMVVHMRAQQALTVLPYDFFVFAAFQQVLARRLGADVGRYLHYSGTFHFYEDEVEAARDIVREGPESIAMPALDPADPTLDALLAFERDLRSSVIAGDATTPLLHEPLNVNTFQGLSKAVLQLYAQTKLGFELEQHPHARIQEPSIQQLIKYWRRS